MKCTCNMENTRRKTHLASCGLSPIRKCSGNAQQVVIEYTCSNCAQPIYFSAEEKLWYHVKNNIRNCAIPYFPFATPRVKVIK